jgi:hypothetical protein
VEEMIDNTGIQTETVTRSTMKKDIAPIQVSRCMQRGKIAINSTFTFECDHCSDHVVRGPKYMISKGSAVIAFVCRRCAGVYLQWQIKEMEAA